MTIQHITLQSLSSFIGEDRAIRSCSPICFYMILGGAGYLPEDELPAKYMERLASSDLHTTNSDWSRPALTKALRELYGASIVSWQLFGAADIEPMKRSGYLGSDKEVSFFKNKVRGTEIKDLVAEGFPVIVTMKPGFGSEHNKNIHAVIIVDWDDGEVTVIDPDGRNTKEVFPEKHVLEFINPKGAGSIVLPKADA